MRGSPNFAQMGFARQMVINIIGATPDRFDLSAEAALVDDLGADSLDLIELQCELESHGIVASDSAFTSTMTLGELAALIVLPTAKATGQEGGAL